MFVVYFVFVICKGYEDGLVFIFYLYFILVRFLGLFVLFGYLYVYRKNTFTCVRIVRL